MSLSKVSSPESGIRLSIFICSLHYDMVIKASAQWSDNAVNRALSSPCSTSASAMATT